MDDLTVARALHVLSLVHWSVSMVTLVLLPGLIRAVPAAQRLALFEVIEGRFARQARISTVIAGASAGGNRGAAACRNLSQPCRGMARRPQKQPGHDAGYVEIRPCRRGLAYACCRGQHGNVAEGITPRARRREPKKLENPRRQEAQESGADCGEHHHEPRRRLPHVEQQERGNRQREVLGARDARRPDGMVESGQK